LENDIVIYKHQVSVPAETPAITEQHRLHHLLDGTPTGVKLPYKYPNETLQIMQNTNAQTPKMLTFKESKGVR